jgi:hypothetical protein
MRRRITPLQKVPFFEEFIFSVNAYVCNPSHRGRRPMGKMPRNCLLFVATVAFSLFAADEPAWKNKQIADWSDDDAQQVLKDSAWIKKVAPTVNTPNRQPGAGGGGRRGGGINLGGIGLGYPGGGMGRRGGYGGGYPGGGYPGGGGTGDSDTRSSTPPTLTLRWESALPVRSAELKARDINAPTLDEDHYAVAVYGVPRAMMSGDSKTLNDQLKKDAALKRDGKKDLKPSSVDVLEREDGPVVVFLFPRSKEITREDKRVEFDAKIGRLEFTESFFPEDMMYFGKLEL